MLKLEKSTQFSGVSVRMRERDRFFEKRLLKALAYALLFHIGALFLFHVTPFSFNSSFVFPPVTVNSELPSSTSVAIATIDQSPADTELQPSLFSLIPPLEMDIASKETLFSPSWALNPNAFDAFEQRIWSTWDSPPTAPWEEPRIQLAISGELARHTLVVTDPLLGEKQSIFKPAIPAYVTYRVQMDEESGELFWFEMLQSSGFKEIDQMTEKILTNLRFAVDNSLESVVGTLNFVVLSDHHG